MNQWKNWRIERKKDLMANDYMLDKVLNKNKKLVGMVKLWLIRTINYQVILILWY